jgi:hypothetical protein
LQGPETLFYVCLVDRLDRARGSCLVEAVFPDELGGSRDILPNVGQ